MNRSQDIGVMREKEGLRNSRRFVPSPGSPTLQK